MVGSAGDVGRVGFYVDAHEHGVVDVAVLLEPNDVCVLEDAVDPHGCVEKNGGLHECAFFPWWCFLLVPTVYHANARRVYMCRCLALVGVLGVGVLWPRRRVVAVRGCVCSCVLCYRFMERSMLWKMLAVPNGARV